MDGTLGQVSGSTDSYVEAAHQNVEAWWSKRGDTVKTKVACVFPAGWEPELDVADLLIDEEVSCYDFVSSITGWPILDG